jgi:hypothetical protein
MALISPGVQVTVIDESTYQPTAVGTVAYVLLATGQDKQNPSGVTASYTTKSNANKLFAVSSQRDLVTNYGLPNFVQDSSGSPIHGHELNEYGLLAAYSALGVASRVYVQRADVNLTQLKGTGNRPHGTPVDGTYWLDLSNTNFGVYEFNDNAFTLQTPAILTDASQIDNGKPRFGAIGSYAVVASSSRNPLFYKRGGDTTDQLNNTWVLVGSDDWKMAVPTIVGTISNPTLGASDRLIINGTNVQVGGTTVGSARDSINNAGIQGVMATVNGLGQLEIKIDSTSASTGNTALADGAVRISKYTYGDYNDAAANLGLFTTAIDGSATNKKLYAPALTFAPSNQHPAWLNKTSTIPGDATPRPYGSVWLKTTAQGNGASYAMDEYQALADSWTPTPAPLYQDDNAAIYGLDPVGGGIDLKVGTLYIKYDSYAEGTATFKPYIKTVKGLLKITGSILTGANPFNSGDTFSLEVSVPGSASTVSATITLSSTTSASFVADILSARLPNVVAIVESSGAISLSHLAGGTIKLMDVLGTPLVTAGLTTDTSLVVTPHVQQVKDSMGNTMYYLASPFVAMDLTGVPYIPSITAPFSNPADGTLWYYSDPLAVDIMMNDGSGWRGYKNVQQDARGYDLTLTDSLGPILSASAPTTQVNGAPLVAGDLWVDTSMLDSYPNIYRFTDGRVWSLIDNTDQVSVNGILFADARWSYNGTTNPITDAKPDVIALQGSDYIDSDCPDYRLYARGTLLFNTRRSGYNVKRFESTWFADKPFETDGSYPSVLSAWVSHSGRDENEVPYFGHKAQRSVVVTALKAAIESSTDLREEQTQFNLIVCPGYPELMQNMITLNDDRKQTAFIIGDTPIDLSSSSNGLMQYTSNALLAQDNGEKGLVSTSEYLGVFYPSGLATNLDGNSVAVPPSHAMLRTFIRSDNVSYPWFAPAGVRRGLIDNLTAIGYVDTTDNNAFRSIGVTNSLRDILYENRVNPLTVLPGVGLVNYGQKTRAAMTSAMDRINVARLVCYLRLVLAQTAAPFIFEPNDTITRNQVKGAFEAVLNDVVAKRGIYDYLVVCDTSNNTPDRIDRNELWVDIAIEPVKAIEFIYIPVRLKATGAIAKGI